MMRFENKLRSLKKGHVLKNEELIDIFECQHRGGMRKSNKNNCLILISDNTNPLYKNYWDKDILNYTGMGQSGDQDINFMQNKTLHESNKNKTRLFLFEVFKKTEYTYSGEVKYLDRYKIEKQFDKNDELRDVIVFSLELKEDFFIKEDTVEYTSKNIEKEIQKLDDKKLLKLTNLQDANKISKRYMETIKYDRNPYIVEFSRRRAGAFCELCKKEAPFLNKEKQPYLEVHHIEWLSRGGLDSIENTAALCPNCHKKMHILDDAKDIKTLKAIRLKEK